MAPMLQGDAVDTDASMSDAPAHHNVERMVRSTNSCRKRVFPPLTAPQDVDETPDYTDSDTNPNTTASSVAGEPVGDGRKRRSEATALRRSIFGKKHDRLGESKVGSDSVCDQLRIHLITDMPLILTLNAGR